MYLCSSGRQYGGEGQSATERLTGVKGTEGNRFAEEFQAPVPSTPQPGPASGNVLATARSFEFDLLCNENVDEL